MTNHGRYSISGGQTADTNLRWSFGGKNLSRVNGERKRDTVTEGERARDLEPVYYYLLF